MKRREAQALGLSKYVTGKPCVRGHFVERYTTTGTCTTCSTEMQRREHVRQYNKNWKLKKKEEDPDYRKEAIKKHRLMNKEKLAAYLIAYRQTPQGAAVHRSYKSRRRKSSKLLGKIWIKEIQLIYKACKIITELTGVKHNVDHIIPISNKQVTGLNVPWNLQIIPSKENYLKSNKFNPEIAEVFIMQKVYTV